LRLVVGLSAQRKKGQVFTTAGKQPGMFGHTPWTFSPHLALNSGRYPLKGRKKTTEGVVSTWKTFHTVADGLSTFFLVATKNPAAAKKPGFMVGGAKERTLCAGAWVLVLR